MTTTSSSQRSQASSSLTDVSQVPIYNINTCVEFSMLHQFPPSTAHITAKDADAQTYSKLLKPIGRILSNATPQLWLKCEDVIIANPSSTVPPTFIHRPD
ncbi:hypothetical protein V8E52_009562 [Russula decolorans]